LLGTTLPQQCSAALFENLFIEKNALDRILERNRMVEIVRMCSGFEVRVVVKHVVVSLKFSGPVKATNQLINRLMKFSNNLFME